MAEHIKVKIKPLTAEAFAPYGTVLERKKLVYPEVEEGRVAMEMLSFQYRPNARIMDQMAIHFSYNQTFIPVQGSLILVVAPPPAAVREALRNMHLIMTTWQLLMSIPVRLPLSIRARGITR